MVVSEVIGICTCLATVFLRAIIEIAIASVEKITVDSKIARIISWVHISKHRL